jgi:hypothetical protein
MDLKPGSRWKSAVCAAEAVVVRAPSGPVTLTCGGAAMLAWAIERPAAAHAIPPTHGAGTLLGKRYGDAETGLEVLCAKPGVGSLSVDGRPLVVKDAKKLPASD